MTAPKHTPARHLSAEDFEPKTRLVTMDEDGNLHVRLAPCTAAAAVAATIVVPLLILIMAALP